MKYKQYGCSYGDIILFADGTVEFIPYEDCSDEEIEDEDFAPELDFDNSETCELLAEDDDGEDEPEQI